MNKKGIHRIANGYRYLFVKPNGEDNVRYTAEKLIGIKSVIEVVITEGHFGFAVKAEDNAKATSDSINGPAHGTSRMVACYYHYVK